MTGVKLTVRLWALLVASALSLSLLAPVGAVADEPVGVPELLTPVNLSSSTELPTFTWSAVTDARSYKFQMSTTADFASRFYETTIAGRSLTLPQNKEPAVSTTYYWRVAANLPDGTLTDYPSASSFQRNRAAGPELLAPLPQEDAEVAVVDYPTAPTLKWAAIPGADDYTVQWSTDSGFSSGVTSKTTAGTALVLPTLVVEGTPYYWRVRANLVSSVTTDYSTAGQFMVAWPSELRPNLLYPADEVDVPWSQVHFAWTTVVGASRYQIQLSPDADFPDDNTVDQTVTNTHFIPRATLLDDTYYWRVRALSTDATRPGPWSVGSGPDGVQRVTRVWLQDGVAARPAVWAGDVGDQPEGDPGTWSLTTSLPKNAIALSWTPIAGASYYEVQIAESQSFIDMPSPVNNDDVLTCKTPHTTLTPDSTLGEYKRTTDRFDCAWEPGSDTLTRSGVSVTEDRTYYVRVRAIDETTGGDTVASLWSNDPRANEELRDPLGVTLVANVDAGTSLTEPAQKIAPANGATVEDTPLLSWRPVAGATKYLVALSVNSGFTSRETSLLWFTVTGTRFIPPQSYLDNEAGKPFYWFVTPCAATCDVGDSAGAPTRWTFTKSSHAVTGLVATPLRGVADRQDPAPVGVAEDVACAVDADGPSPLAPDPRTGVCLSWTDAHATSQETAADGGGAGTAHYQVQVSTDPSFTVSNTLDTTTDATAIVPEVRLDDSTYYWRVRAKDGGSLNGPWSASGSFVRPRPPKPDLNASSDSISPLLTWSALAGASAYQLEIYSGGQLTGDPITAAGTTTAAYAGHAPLVGLARGAYTWRVRFKDAYGVAGDWSDPRTFNVGTGPVPLVSPAAGGQVKVMAKDLALNWSEMPGVSGYRAEISSKLDFSTIADSGVVTDTSWTPRPSGGMSAGQYYWRIRPLNANDQSLSDSRNDEVRSFTVQTPPSTPGSIGGTATAVDGQAQVGVQWAASTLTGESPIIGHRVRYRTRDVGSWTVQSTDGAAVATTVTGLAAATDYEFQVAAENAVGTSLYSSSKYVRTPGAPNAPSSLVAALGFGRIDFSWRAPTTNGSPVVAYRVAVTPLGGSPSYTDVLPPAVGVAVPNEVALPGLTQGQTYRVSVTARNGIGTGPEAVADNLVIPTQPGKPTAVRVTRRDGSLLVSWLPPSNAAATTITSYLIEKRSLTNGAWSSWSTARLSEAAASRSYLVTGLTNGTSYQLRVTAKSSLGPGVTGDPVGAVPAGLPSKPSVTLSASAGRMIIKWTRPSTNGAALTGYVVQTSPNGTSWRTVASPSASGASFTWPVPKRRVTYYAHVAAKNAVGTGLFSTSRSIVVP